MKHPLTLALAIVLSGSLGACADADAAKSGRGAIVRRPSSPAAAAAAEQSLLRAGSPLPFQFPQFDRIKNRDSLPASTPAWPAARRDRRDREEPARRPSRTPSWRWRRPGKCSRAPRRCSSTCRRRQERRAKLAVRYAPKLSAHGDAIALKPQAVRADRAAVRQRDKLGLDAEGAPARRYHTDFVRAGAKLTDADKTS